MSKFSPKRRTRGWPGVVAVIDVEREVERREVEVGVGGMADDIFAADSLTLSLAGVFVAFLLPLKLYFFFVVLFTLFIFTGSGVGGGGRGEAAALQMSGGEERSDEWKVLNIVVGGIREERKATAPAVALLLPSPGC